MIGRAYRSLRWLTFLVTPLAFTRVAGAQSDEAASTPTSQAPPLSVDVTLIGVPDHNALPDRIVSWFDPRQFRVRIIQAASLDAERLLSVRPPPNSVSVWVFLGKSDARLYFTTTDAGGQPVFFIHRIDLDLGLDEVGAERLAGVIRLSTAALAEGRVATPRDEIAKSLRGEHAMPAKPPPITAKRQLSPHPVTALPNQLWVGVGYAAVWRGAEGLGHGPRLSLTKNFGALGLQLHGDGVVPHEAHLGGFSLSLSSASFGLAVGVHGQLQRLKLRGLFGAGASIEHFSSTSSNANRVTTNGVTELRPYLQLRGELGVLLGKFELAVGLQCGVWLERTRYLLERAGDYRDLGGPRALSPGTTVELRF